MFRFATSLHIVLPSYKVPQEIAPIHIIELIGNEISQVFFLCGSNLVSSCPIFVRRSHALTPHPGKQHILSIAHVFFMPDYFIFAFFFIRAIYSTPLCGFYSVIVTLGHIFRFGSVGFSIKQGSTFILLSVQITFERKNIVRRILIKRSIGVGTNQYHRIGGIAYGEHKQAP